MLQFLKQNVVIHRIKNFSQVQKDSNCGLTSFKVVGDLWMDDREGIRSSDVDENIIMASGFFSSWDSNLLKLFSFNNQILKY